MRGTETDMPWGYLTVDQVALRIGRSPSGVRVLLRRGYFPHAVKFGTRVGVPIDDVHEYERNLWWSSSGRIVRKDT